MRGLASNEDTSCFDVLTKEHICSLMSPRHIAPFSEKNIQHLETEKEQCLQSKCMMADIRLIVDENSVSLMLKFVMKTVGVSKTAT